MTSGRRPYLAPGLIPYEAWLVRGWANDPNLRPSSKELTAAVQFYYEASMHRVQIICSIFIIFDIRILHQNFPSYLNRLQRRQIFRLIWNRFDTFSLEIILGSVICRLQVSQIQPIPRNRLLIQIQIDNRFEIQISAIGREDLFITIRSLLPKKVVPHHTSPSPL